jgi:hypothetical protein
MTGKALRLAFFGGRARPRFSSSEALSRGNLLLLGIVLHSRRVRLFVSAFAVCLTVLYAQAPEPGVGQDSALVREGSEIGRAEEELRRVKSLFEAGAASRAQVEKVQSVLEEARDHEVLRATLYGHIAIEELTEQQSSGMIEAAQRNVDRKQRLYDEALKLVTEGVRSRASLEPVRQEVEESRRVHAEALSRGRLFSELSEIVRAEQEAALHLEDRPNEPLPFVYRYDGDGKFETAHLKLAVLGFEKEFSKPLPISARGETALHRALGYDHRGRVDVGVSPDSKEGQWLRQFLEANRVPYFAFRGAVRGKSTAAHFHLGPPSLSLRRAD